MVAARWHKGTVYAEKKNAPRVAFDEDAQKVMEDIKIIKTNRHWGQPYVSDPYYRERTLFMVTRQLAIYAFSVCMLVLFTNGWYVTSL